MAPSQHWSQQQQINRPQQQMNHQPQHILSNQGLIQQKIDQMLHEMFPGRQADIRRTRAELPDETDVSKLANHILNMR